MTLSHKILSPVISQSKDVDNDNQFDLLPDNSCPQRTGCRGLVPVRLFLAFLALSLATLLFPILTLNE